ncbi:glycoside hydrolase family 97 C-terminal domain-containing protein [Chryseobacterium sp. Mn2064]|uniref:glycoside hydrolase family 97 C-terminal domain-containing protein n=1 Tax=Chryseobacterium sp. Mn2064 TaxID=3395263 RepID=UPI003BD1934A
MKDAAVDWDDSYILEAEPSDFIMIVRKAKNKNEWYVVGITNENERTVMINFNFLPKGKKFEETIYEEEKKTDWKTRIIDYKINKKTITSNTVLKKKLAQSNQSRKKNQSTWHYQLQ